MSRDESPPGPVRRRRELAAWVVLLLMAISGLLAVAGFFSNHMGYLFLQRASEGLPNNPDAFLAHWHSLLFINRAQAVLFLITGLAFLHWAHLGFTKPIGFRGPGTISSKYEAVWVWFVPILNVYKPYGIVRDLWKGKGAGGKEQASQTIPWVFPFWWTTFLGAITLEVFTIIRKNLVLGTAQAAALSKFIMFVDVLWFLAAGSGIAVVLKIRKQQIN